MKYKANLDILRSFAVGAVICDHLVRTLRIFSGLNNPTLIRFTSNIGHAGVVAFFVHTSLVLMYSLQRMHAVTDHVTLRFYARRFFRIYPLAIFSILLALVFHIPSDLWNFQETITPQVIVSNLLLIQNIFTKQDVLAPLWSLPYEVQMYLVLPALYFLASRKRGFLYILAVFAMFSALGITIAMVTGHPKMVAYVPCFLSGVLCYSLHKKIPEIVPAAWWPVFLLVLIYGYCVASLQGFETYKIDWTFSLLLGLGINLFRDSTSTALNFGANKIALYSYGIYLLHVPVLYLVFSKLHVHSLPVGTGLFLAITGAASFLAFHGVESPLIEFGRRITSEGYRRSSPDANAVNSAP